MAERYRFTTTSTADGLVLGALYPAAVTRFDGPLLLFPLRAEQVLPRVAPGALAEVEGDVERARVQWVRCADGTVIRPAGGAIRSEGFPLYAEVPTCWHPVFLPRKRWTGAASSPPSLETRQSLAAREDRVGRSVLKALGLATVPAVGAAVLLPVTAWVVAGGLGLLAIVGLTSVGHARREQRQVRALRDLDRTPAQELRLSLWWRVGRTVHPEPMASLAGGMGAPHVLAEVALTGVPPGFDPEPWTNVVVHGEVGGDAPLHLRCGAVDLWSR